MKQTKKKKIKMDKKKKFDTKHIYSMKFELAMLLLLGSDASHIAGFAINETIVKKWLRRAIRTIIIDVNNIETTMRHKEMLILDLNSLDELIKTNGNIWEIIFSFFELIGRLLGYDYSNGNKLLTPVYIQSRHQDFWSGLYSGKTYQEIDKIKNNLIGKRKKIVQKLKKENYSDFEISIIMDTTEYKIKKIFQEINLKVKPQKLNK